MSPSRRSPRLTSAIGKEPSRHPAAREPPSQSSRLPASGDHDAVILQPHVDFVAGMQLYLVANRLWDHDLSLSAHLASHTR